MDSDKVEFWNYEDKWNIAVNNTFQCMQLEIRRKRVNRKVEFGRLKILKTTTKCDLLIFPFCFSF